jgi:hypothetical protein
MPAQAGIQGREGMDTGFRRYDGSRPDRTCVGIFEGGYQEHEVRNSNLSEPFVSFVIFVVNDFKEDTSCS